MRTVGAFEAKNTFGTLLDWVEQGEEVLVTRHGRPVARLIPNDSAPSHALARAAAGRILARARTAGGFDWAALKADRDGDRP
ncbi:type II toxin-antitoxin system Phd/YefM family antitoxin [Telmatobacter bradus]|uniref:type II toxin-antitoxin system Phd/YefM family antitoxin n=1 Tax=Telmatobacter bradus TaxID=474953 RepID=UPI003B43C53A